jgi:hypothetical protein
MRILYILAMQILVIVVTTPCLIIEIDVRALEGT